MTTPVIDMVLFCPQCGVQHIDEPSPGWDNPPHRSHLCCVCKHVWRPADVCTNGVAFVHTKGSADSWPIRTRGTSDLGHAADLRKAKEELEFIRSRYRSLQTLGDRYGRALYAIATGHVAAQALARDVLRLGHPQAQNQHS